MTKLEMVGVPEHSNLPFRWLNEAGDDVAAGVELSWRDVASGTGEMVRMLEEGEADVGVLLTEGALAAAWSGRGVRVWRLYCSSPLLWGVHVDAGSRFESEGDLAGCTFARSKPGSGSHLMALVGARALGWDPAALRFADVGDLPGAMRSMSAGESDAFLWERFTTKPVVDSGRWRCVGVWPTPWPSFVLAVRSDLGSDEVAALGALMPALRRQCDRMHGGDESVREISLRHGQRPDDVAQWLSGTVFAPGEPMDASTVQDVYRSLRACGAVAELDEAALETAFA
jgi:hypothetical protein